MPRETYFTCTLGQAAAYRHGKEYEEDFKNIPRFVEQLASSEHANRPAVGFYNLPVSDRTTAEWTTRILTFAEVDKAVRAAAVLLHTTVKIKEGQTVAMICASNADFLFLWLALMRLGHPVLHVAPQCSATATAQLCRQCGVEYLFYDDVHEDLALRSMETASGLEKPFALNLRLIPFEDQSRVFDMVDGERASSPLPECPDMQPGDIAYLHHTSGTSSGVPKPIPQFHKAGGGVQPRLDGTREATFTTTPLYHGGSADLFRAWTSNALVWLFPSKELPITADNVIKCLDTSGKANQYPPIRYFTSVPYVLEMMATSTKGLRYLQQMDIVGVGGAALPVEIGNRLVEQGVNLVSRYGSAECGFLMCSHRDYSNDKAWQCIRPAGPEARPLNLRFEKQRTDDGTYELVVLKGWPHMAKTNREDGSFATSDLFMPHPHIPNAWKYHSRADAQLTLITGLKFDPSPLESSLAASSQLISDVLIFGNGRPYPGALLFRSAEGRDASDKELMGALASKVEQLNVESQSHARIPRNMLIPMEFSDMPLEKSSKGTILRGQAEKRYATEMQSAYDHVTLDTEEVSDEKVESKIAALVDTIMASAAHRSGALGPETDLFAYGVDSVASVQIRHALTQLVPNTDAELPMTVVQDAGTIRKLSQTVLDLRHGRSHATENDGDDQYQLMQSLVEEYGKVSAPKQSSTQPSSQDNVRRDSGKMTVLMTGSTGSIGSHLLSQLLCAPKVQHIHLLLRGSTEHAARERVTKALDSRKLPVPSDFDEKVTIHTCTLADVRLGLSENDFSLLARETDLIYHFAWSVDFILPLNGFKQHFTGLQSLLSLSLTGSEYRQKPARLIYCSSTASVSSFRETHASGVIPEHVITDPRVSGNIGYSRSKWVAENICERAMLSRESLKGRVTVVRVGQVSGDTVHGIWNKTEAYPLMLSSAKVTGCLPDLPQQSLDWIPVDQAAAAFVQIGLTGESEDDCPEPNVDGSTLHVKALHVLNQDTSTSWRTLAEIICKMEDKIKIVPVDEWLQRLQDLQNSSEQHKRDHPSLKLLRFWQNQYREQKNRLDQHQNPDKRRAQFAQEASRTVMPVLSKVGPVERAHVRRLWSWIASNV